MRVLAKTYIIVISPHYLYFRFCILKQWRIINPDIVFAAALGHSYSPQEDRGVFRTMKGGEIWEKVLFVDENTGGETWPWIPTIPGFCLPG
jgi:hypothetical protein